MNKRALIGLVLVPIVLAGAVWWARQKAWQRMESQFRHDLIASDVGDPIHISINNQTLIYDWHDHPKPHAKFFACVNLIRLIPSTKPITNKKGSILISINTDQMGPVDHITLSSTTDEGWISLLPPLNKWNKYQIAPESCRAIKRRLWAEFGPQLRELHIPPPQ